MAKSEEIYKAWFKRKQKIIPGYSNNIPIEYGHLAAIYQLSNGDITKWDVIDNMSWAKCMEWLCFSVHKSDDEAAYRAALQADYDRKLKRGR